MIGVTLPCIIPTAKPILITKYSVTIGGAFSYETEPENPNFIIINNLGNDEYIKLREKWI